MSIDLVEEVIERQLGKYKNKIVDKQQSAANFQAYLDKDYEEDEVKIIRTKKFDIKPMYQKMHVFRWNFLDIISSYSAMQRLIR